MNYKVFSGVLLVSGHLCFFVEAVKYYYNSKVPGFIE